ncbi:MAG: protein kinase [Acidobacteriota bacterium]
MTPERWRQIEELFRTVVDRPAVEREALLTRVCHGDEELRREVLSLLARDTADDFLQEPIAGAAVSLTSEPKEDLTGKHIGPYLVTRLIGHGGMGAVYEAVRDDAQFQQRVAVKFIKRGMDTEFVRDRFLRERQILASLEHPYIARLYDGGTTADGLPYFVMELVTGEPITNYCRRQQLSLTQKLRLFRDVCAAVQHAHQKLVVHRDLKPSNILVSDAAEGKAPTPKLLDFGIAKLLTSDLREANTRTETSVRLMTPDYASPEQVRGEAITTATDVYSLGVVLYELLTGRRPYQFETFTPLEIERVVCDTEAVRPSEAARQQTGNTAKLARQLEGDLDNIILMALRKEPARRYQSVEQFSEDIRRYLTGLPVTACQDTLGYRASKFVRRHKTGIVMLTLLALLAVTMTVQTVRVTRERARAERRFAQVRKLSNTFLFDFHDKIQNVPGTVEARGLVAKTAQEYLDSLVPDATGDAQLEWELAVAYQKVGDVQGDPWDFNLGQSREAMQSYQKSLALAQQLQRMGNTDVKMARLLAESYFKLGALQAQSAGQAAAQATLKQALAAAETLERQTREAEDIRLLQNCYARLGDTYLDSGDPVNALAIYRQGLRISERRAAESPGDRAQLGLALDHPRVAEALAATGDVDGAMMHFRQSLTLIDELLPRHAEDAFYLRVRMIALIWLGNLSGNPRFINLGEPQTALQHYRAALALAERIAAPETKNVRAQLDVAGGHGLVADILTLTQPAQAVEHYRQALTIVRALDAQDAQRLRREAQYLKGQAAALRRLGDRTSALQNLRQAVQIRRELLARDSADSKMRADLQPVLLDLADVLLESGDHQDALAHYREALTLAETPSVTESADVSVRWRLAEACAGLSRYHRARANAAPLAERAQHWHDARQFAQRSFALWDEWSKQTGAPVFAARRRDEAARWLATCDAAAAR